MSYIEITSLNMFSVCTEGNVFVLVTLVESLCSIFFPLYIRSSSYKALSMLLSILVIWKQL